MGNEISTKFGVTQGKNSSCDIFSFYTSDIPCCFEEQTQMTGDALLLHLVKLLQLDDDTFTACLTDPARVQPGGKMSHPGPTRSQKSAPGLNPQTRDRFHRNPGKNRRNPETETRNPDRIFENPGLTRPVKPETRWTRSKNFSRSGSVRQAVKCVEISTNF